MSPEMIPLSALLDQLEKDGAKLYAGNLTTTRGRQISVMQQLAEEDLARQEGRRWMVSPDAGARLLALARGGRPGPGPGAQVTLDAEQIGPFARVLASATDPANAVQEALEAATGWGRDVVDQVERVVIPVAPRRPGAPSK